MCSLFSLRVLRTVATALLAAVSTALAANPTVFWIEPRSNVTFDSQVTEAVGKRAGLVVLRATWRAQAPEYTLPAVVARFKSDTKAPVLSYAWATRYSTYGRGEADLLRDFKPGNPVAQGKGDANSTVDFLDITNPEVRSRVVSRFVEARKTLGVDGFAVDLSTRTPTVRPTELARRCKQETSFCPQYANGMDALFADLRRELGAETLIAFNGLFNFAPGQLKDQAKLLASTDAAAIEFFGMDPKEKQHSFSKDIRPFLELLPTLPEKKTVMVFGRGPWSYNDYAQDLLWQRYLYASFLLAARPNDMFKYHSTFQVPTQYGRTGGLDYFEDWKVDLGTARGPAKESGGVIWRGYSGGFVAVAPDDGRGGTVDLGRTFYTLQGQRMAGQVRLSPGEALVLLNEARPELRKPAAQTIDAKTIASWKWARAQMESVDGRDVVRVAPSNIAGDRDVLLDYERSTTPYERLEIDASLLESSSAILAVAEIDDPKREYMHMVVEIVQAPRVTGLHLADAVHFRSPTAKSGELWPRIQVAAAGPKAITLSAAPIDAAGYSFRRWSHLRIVGPARVARFELSQPTNRVRERP